MSISRAKRLSCLFWFKNTLLCAAIFSAGRTSVCWYCDNICVLTKLTKVCGYSKPSPFAGGLFLKNPVNGEAAIRKVKMGIGEPKTQET